jgi:hypothetical protein
MKVLKGLALSLLGFLLFLSLSVFGLALTLNSTILNPDFVVSELDNLDVPSLTGEVIDEQVRRGEFSPELGTALVNTITKLDPVIKEQVGAATHTIYDYLLGESQSPDLALMLRTTLLSQDFIASLVDELDILALVREFVSEQLLAAEIPPEIEPYLAKYLDDALTELEPELEPWLKEQLVSAADPIVDYLLGESQSLNVVIPLEPVGEMLRDGLWQAFLQSPPPELAGIPQPLIKQFFDDFYEQAIAPQIPSTIEFDESLVGTEAPAQIGEALAAAEWGLEQGRQYVSYVQLSYNILIGLMVLLVAGIILLIRRVKGATRELGVIFLTYGAFEYVGILAAKHFGLPWLADQLPLPAALQAWLPQLISDFLTPLEMFSLGLLIGGAVLIVFSFIYKRGEPSDLE